MFFRHNLDKITYPLVAAVLLIVISYRPTYRLRPTMPKEFFSATEPCGSKRPIDQKIACAYWDSAQMDIQWKYPHGHPLPADVPPEFSINTPALGPLASAPATRELYWHRLQQVWNLPETWNEKYEWNLGWASDPLTSSGQWLKDHLGQMFTIK
jgi:hypothetical protein